MATAIKFFFFLFFVVLGIGYVIRPDINPPQNAQVYLNTSTEEYYSPVCLTREQQKEHKVVQIRFMTYPQKQNKECTQAGHFVQKGNSLTERVLVDAGFLDPPPSRWNEDGTWNW